MEIPSSSLYSDGLHWCIIFLRFWVLNLKSFDAGHRRTVSVSAGGKESIAGMIASLVEGVRTTTACECVYVRAAAIKALIWMQSPYEPVEELKAIVTGELADPTWPSALLNDILLTLHARFKVCIFSILVFSLEKFHLRL